MCSPTGWVVTVAMNVARSRARRRAAEENLLRRHRVYESLPAPAGEVFDVVRLLPRQQRTVVLLRYVVDLAAADIADLLGISRSTVSSTLTNAHRRLALLLVDEPLGSPEIGGSDE